MSLINDNGLSRYKEPFVMFMLLFCVSVNAKTVDEVWAATPYSQDTQWAQGNLGPVNPSHNGGSTKYQIFNYSGSWGSAADFGWHHWCSMTAHTANGDRGTGWNLHTTSFDPATTKSYWRVTYYNISSWGATCYDVL
ncbi:hypothetical protein [Aeromonas veronii]|uniref:hypothetical protein n=1 Tax=Aeromonas veronii TaxID=654 RepID=UPI001130B209|nr:hypothetical protein [Aeromonas veronii]